MPTSLKLRAVGWVLFVSFIGLPLVVAMMSFFA